MDAAGNTLRDAYIQTNANFASLYAATQGTAQVINTGTYPNDGTGDTMPVALSKINANFAYLWSLAAYSVAQQVINTASVGNIDGVVGFPADPGKLAWLKVNANFQILSP